MQAYPKPGAGQGREAEENDYHKRFPGCSADPLAGTFSLIINSCGYNSITNLGSQAIQQEFPEEYPRAMLAGVKNRQYLIDLFQEFGTGEKPEQQRNEIESPGILLGTTKLLSVGFTCTRANTVVLFEPQLSSNDEEQAYGRIHRISQRNHRTYGYRLIDPDLEEDQRIMMRQASRKKLHRDATQQRYDNQTDADG
jgi:hypothetical protein